MSKVVALLACLTVVAVAVTVSGSDEKATLQQFAAFVRQYGKQYADEVELRTRYENFKASLARISEKNRLSSERGKGATYSVTKFSDMTTDDFKNTILMKRGIPISETPRPIPEKKQVQDMPSSLDWRDKGAVTAVKDQGQCGSCWAFSVTENIESMWILAGKGTNTSVMLAPQQIVDCDDWDLGCNGGNPPEAYDYVIGTGGQEDEPDYPYTAQDGTCQFNKKYVEAKISSYEYATYTYSESELQQSVVSWGPLSVCVDASNWQDYSSGIMTWEECAYVNLLDHCVQLVGYNTQSDGSQYWIVRNSWNTDWGIEGYIYLEKGGWSDTCGIAHEATTSCVNACP